MMPEGSVYGGWPASGEIDVMEHVNVDGKIYGTFHFGKEKIDSEEGGRMGSVAVGHSMEQGYSTRHTILTLLVLTPESFLLQVSRIWALMLLIGTHLVSDGHRSPSPSSSMEVCTTRECGGYLL